MRTEKLSVWRTLRPLLRAKVADLEAADPDRSNPTRPRLERPLATIMSFHAAVDGVYGERAYSKSGEKDFRPEMRSRQVYSLGVLYVADPQTRRQSYYHGRSTQFCSVLHHLAHPLSCDAAL